MLSAGDFVILFGIMAIFAFLGHYFRPGRKANSSEYFLARHTMSPIPAGLSICVSYLSSTMMTIFLGEVIVYGCPTFLYGLPNLISAPIIIIFILPRFYKSQYISVYQYLEERFSRSTRMINAILYIIFGMLNLSVIGYSVSISAEVLAGIPFWICALVAGVFSTFYSTLGGIRAVIWIDTVQAVLMLLFLLFIIFKSIMSFSSLEEFSSVIHTGDRVKMRFEEGPTHRCSGTSFFLFGFLMSFHSLCLGQSSVQRWKSVGSLEEAKKTVLVTAFAHGLLTACQFICGTFLFAFYARCMDNKGPYPTIDKISLYFVETEFSPWPGVRGLCLSGILSGALSTMSSFYNSMAAVTLEDFVKFKFSSLSDEQEITISKFLTAAYGFFCTVLIFVTAKSKIAAVVQLVALSASVYPILAVYLLGMWIPESNSVGVNFGLVASVSLIACMSIGAYMTGQRHKPLPVPNTHCTANKSSVVALVTEGIVRRLPPEYENDGEVRHGIRLVRMLHQAGPRNTNHVPTVHQSYTSTNCAVASCFKSTMFQPTGTVPFASPLLWFWDTSAALVTPKHRNGYILQEQTVIVKMKRKRIIQTKMPQYIPRKADPLL